MASLAKQAGIILLLNCINGFISGLCARWDIFWGVIGTAVFFLFLWGGLYTMWEKSEAKKRMMTNPITSFDQRGMAMASFVILLIIGLLFVFLALVL